MADYTPVNSDNQAITLKAGAAITGGLLVKISADNTVIHTTLTTERAIGVAAHDAPQSGNVTVYLLPGFVHEILPTYPAGANCTAGAAAVCSTVSGRVDGGAGVQIGTFTRSTAGTSVVRFLGL